MTTQLSFGTDRLCHVCQGKGRHAGKPCLACSGTGVEGRQTDQRPLGVSVHSQDERRALGRAERDAILPRVEASNLRWSALAHRWMKDQPRDSVFTADDLTDAIGQPDRRAAVGSAFSAASKRRLIERAGIAQSAIPTSHASIVQRWRRR